MLLKLLESAVAIVALALPGPGQGTPPDSAAAERLAARIQARYETVRDFSARFEQRYTGGVLRRTTVETGTVQVKKPGRMRWEYVHPERKTFVADGRRLYAYVPADRQVIVTPLPDEDRASTPVLFLAGKGQLLRDFRVALTTVAGAPAGSVALRLTPLQPERDYDWLTLVVDEQTLVIRMLVAGDSQGGTSTFSFSDVRENVGLGDGIFEFRIPRGTDVITQE